MKKSLFIFALCFINLFMVAQTVCIMYADLNNVKLLIATSNNLMEYLS
jgi:hypothetical protein